jgi:chromosome segregation ATPase
MSKNNIKITLSIAFLFIGLNAFSQGKFKKSSKTSAATDTTITGGLPDKDKASNCDDSKKSLKKNDLDDLNDRFKSLQDAINNLQIKVEGIPLEIDAKYTLTKGLEDKAVKSKKTIDSLIVVKSDLQNQFNAKNEELKTKDTKLQDSEKKIKQYEPAFDQLVNDYILNCNSPDNSTIELMKNQLKSFDKKYQPTIDNLEEFKKQSNNLKSATLLLTNPTISKIEFSNAKTNLTNLVSNSKYLGLQEAAKTVKIDYDRFEDLATKLEKTIAEDKTITNQEYRSKVFPEDFRPYIFALNPYPFLVSKYKEALTNPNCTVLK